MKYIFQIPIIVLMLWASGNSYALHGVAFGGGDIEAYITSPCSASSNDGTIEFKVNSNTGPFELEYSIKVNGIWQQLGEPFSLPQPGGNIKKNLSVGEYLCILTYTRDAKAEMKVEVDANEPIIIYADTETGCSLYR